MRIKESWLQFMTEIYNLVTNVKLKYTISLTICETIINNSTIV